MVPRITALVDEAGIEPAQPKRLIYSQVGSTNAQLIHSARRVLPLHHRQHVGPPARN